MQQWTLGSIVMMCGCQLGVEQLEAGDEADDTGEGAENGDGEGDGSGDGDGDAPSDECVVQGSNLAGGTDPLDYPFPTCEVECVSGWGHGAAPLTSEWTLDIHHEGPTTGFTHLGLLPNGDLLAFTAWFSEEGLPARLVWLSPEGEVLGDMTQPAISDAVWDVGIDADGIIYALWRDGDMQSLTALSSSGEHLWTVELGPYLFYDSVLAARDSGVVVALNPAENIETAELLRVSADGQVDSMGGIPITTEIAVSPGDNTVAVANATTIRWSDFDVFPDWRTEGVADATLVFGLAALDDDRFAAVGTTENWDEEGSLHAFIKQVGLMGLEWEDHYDRASSWCPAPGDETGEATREAFIDVVRLADGSLLVVGRETAAYPERQPLVLHVSDDGEVLGSDRGFWRGEAIAAVGASDGAAYVLMHEFEDSDPELGNQKLYVRKYAP